DTSVLLSFPTRRSSDLLTTLLLRLMYSILILKTASSFPVICLVHKLKIWSLNSELSVSRYSLTLLIPKPGASTLRQVIVRSSVKKVRFYSKVLSTPHATDWQVAFARRHSWISRSGRVFLAAKLVWNWQGNVLKTR